jgi:hypothetical protein
MKFIENGPFLISEDGAITLTGLQTEAPAIVLFDGGDIALAAEVFNKYRCRQLSVAQFGGTSLDLSAFRDLDQLTRLSIEATGSSALELKVNTNVSFDKLLELELRGRVPTNFPKISTIRSLRRLVVEDAEKDLPDWSTSQYIVDLVVHRLRGADLGRLKGLKNIRRLCLVDGAFQTLGGLEGFQHLETLHCVRTRNLVDASSLNACESLVNIKFESFKRIVDWDFLAESDKWKSISVDRARSVRFIRNLPNLQLFYVGQIEDKDKSPIAAHKSLTLADAWRAQNNRDGKPTPYPFTERLI